VAVSPEEIGLSGCWQVIAVERESHDLGKPGAAPTMETGYYASSLSLEQRDDASVGAAIRDHWSAIENGTHHRRDVTLGEDACRVQDRNAAAVLASLRNLANGIYELERARERTQVDTLRSWCQRQTFSSAWPLLQR
jgi:predicted transposase YbfD/YdcC